MWGALAVGIHCLQRCGVYGWFSLRVGLTREPADAFGLSFERFVGVPGDGTHRSGGERVRVCANRPGVPGHPPGKCVPPLEPDCDRKGWR